MDNRPAAPDDRHAANASSLRAIDRERASWRTAHAPTDANIMATAAADWPRTRGSGVAETISDAVFTALPFDGSGKLGDWLAFAERPGPRETAKRPSPMARWQDSRSRFG